MGIGNWFLFPYVLISAFLKVSRIIVVHLWKKMGYAVLYTACDWKTGTAGKREKTLARSLRTFFLWSISWNFLSHRSFSMNNSLMEQQQNGNPTLFYELSTFQGQSRAGPLNSGKWVETCWKPTGAHQQRWETARETDLRLRRGPTQVWKA